MVITAVIFIALARDGAKRLGSAVVPLYCFWLCVLANRPTFLVVLIADDGLTSRAIREHHLECALFGCVSKCVVRPHDVVQREAMSYELARL